MISALVAITTALVVVDRHQKQGLSAPNTNNSSSGAQPAAAPTFSAVDCQEVTNIFQDCSCQQERTTVPSKEIEYNRELVLEYLMGLGAISMEDTGNVTTMSVQSCDPRNQALLWVSDLENHVDGIRPANLQILQRFVLAILFQRLDGNDWTSKNLWLDPKTSECEWEGIVCNTVTDRIMELNLNDKNLRGELPSLELGTFVGLRDLNMENNPSLTGLLTPQLTTLPLLQSLYLSSTSISGSLPTEFGTRLAELHLSSTVLKGTLPSELGLIARLREVYLSHNRFSGTIPKELIMSSELEVLDLSSNQLTGSLPAAADWQSSALDTLNLSENIRLVGPYPDPPSLLLTNANFAGTSLTGTVPGDYCNLVYLEYLLVDCNAGSNSSSSATTATMMPSSCPCCQCDDKS